MKINLNEFELVSQNKNIRLYVEKKPIGIQIAAITDQKDNIELEFFADNIQGNAFIIPEYAHQNTPIDSWILINKPSLRLENAIRNYKNVHQIECIEDVTQERFLKLKFAGTNSWREFEELTK